MSHDGGHDRRFISTKLRYPLLSLLTRRGKHMLLDMAVDARKYRELLKVAARRDSWDWGDRPLQKPGD